MKTTLVTAPGVYPVTVEDAKHHCRIDINTDDRYVEGLIATATSRVEELTWRRLITQTWDLFLDDWPSGNHITIPYGSLSSVTSVKYKDTDASETTWSSAEYIVDTDSDAGRVVLGYGYTWPNTTLYPSNPITVRFVCGYGASDTDVPYQLTAAIKILVQELYENRENSVMGISYTKINTVENLCRDFKIFY